MGVPFLQSTPSIDTDDRYLPSQLGSTSTDSHGTGQVVPVGIHIAHQLPRIKCSLQCMPTLSTNNQTKDCKSNDGQHRLHVLYQRTGGAVSIPMCRSTKIVELVHPTWHQHFCCVPTWTPEHHSRLTEQEVLTRICVGDRHKNPTTHVEPLEILKHRSVHHTQKHQIPTIQIKSRSGSPISKPFHPFPYYSKCLTKYKWNEPQSFS